MLALAVVMALAVLASGADCAAGGSRCAVGADHSLLQAKHSIRTSNMKDASAQGVCTGFGCRPVADNGCTAAALPCCPVVGEPCTSFEDMKNILLVVMKRRKERERDPPDCVRDNPHAVYLEQEFTVTGDHVDCAFGGLCGKRIQNREKIDFIRQVTNITKGLIVGAGVPNWTLAGGLAIGAERCGDVLPWDTDCDVMMPEEGMRGLHKQLFGTEDYSYAARQVRLDDRYVVHAKSHCIPLEVVDTRSGFYCDVFVTKAVRDASGHEHHELPWPWSPKRISSAPKCSENGYSWPLEALYPAKDCSVAGETYPCARNQDRYLSEQYGADWRIPDKHWIG